MTLDEIRDALKQAHDAIADALEALEHVTPLTPSDEGTTTRNEAVTTPCPWR